MPPHRYPTDSPIAARSAPPTNFAPSPQVRYKRNSEPRPRVRMYRPFEPLRAPNEYPAARVTCRPFGAPTRDCGAQRVAPCDSPNLSHEASLSPNRSSPRQPVAAIPNCQLLGQRPPAQTELAQLMSVPHSPGNGRFRLNPALHVARIVKDPHLRQTSKMMPLDALSAETRRSSQTVSGLQAGRLRSQTPARGGGCVESLLRLYHAVCLISVPVCPRNCSLFL